jgi:hypothetical protein
LKLNPSLQTLCFELNTDSPRHPAIGHRNKPPHSIALLEQQGLAMQGYYGATHTVELPQNLFCMADLYELT